MCRRVNRRCWSLRRSPRCATEGHHHDYTWPGWTAASGRRLPLANPMHERLLVAVVLSRAAVPVSASSRPTVGPDALSLQGIRVTQSGTSCSSRWAQNAGLPHMKYNAPGRGSPARTWRRTAPSGATHQLARSASAYCGGYRNRRFTIIGDAAWITLYRAALPFPQVGVFLRCAGLAGEAFFTGRSRPSGD